MHIASEMLTNGSRQRSEDMRLGLHMVFGGVQLNLLPAYRQVEGNGGKTETGDRELDVWAGLALNP